MALKPKGSALVMCTLNSEARLPRRDKTRLNFPISYQNICTGLDWMTVQNSSSMVNQEIEKCRCLTKDNISRVGVQNVCSKSAQCLSKCQKLGDRVDENYRKAEDRAVREDIHT